MCLKYLKRKINNKGFTLIELIIVLVILGVLYFSLAPRFGTIRDNAKIRITSAEMAEIAKAIVGDADTGYEGFMTNMGRIPTNAETLSVLYDSSLLANGSATFNPVSQTGWSGPYISEVDNDNNGTADVLEDAWGNPYSYNFAFKLLWSWGPNETNDSAGADDIAIKIGN